MARVLQLQENEIQKMRDYWFWEAGFCLDPGNFDSKNGLYRPPGLDLDMKSLAYKISRILSKIVKPSMFW